MDHQGATGPSVPARWWGPSTTVANADVMNQLCRVCGEPAAGFHFGAFTCEGCKSFFGRTYNNLNSVSECKNNGECIINKKNRTSCKACRLRKCLLVGMSKSGSRYGRRSNWFKIHCLLQEQQLQQQQQQQQQHQQLQGQHNQHSVSALVLPSKKSWEYAKSAAALLDIDNNNTPGVECTKSASPPYSVPHHGLVKTADSPSGFWTSSQPNPLTVPHQHNTLPYFISPFLQNSLQPVSHNYLLPFLPIRPPLPLEPLVISASSPSSLQSSPTSSGTTSKLEVTSEDADSSLKKLHSLGPVQEQPIDLSSVKGAEDDQPLETINQNCNNNDITSKSVAFECTLKNDKEEQRTNATTPLDLRCSKV